MVKWQTQLLQKQPLNRRVGSTPTIGTMEWQSDG